MQEPSDFEITRRDLLKVGAVSMAVSAAPLVAKGQAPVADAPVMSKVSFNGNGKAYNLKVAELGICGVAALAVTLSWFWMSRAPAFSTSSSTAYFVRRSSTVPRSVTTCCCTWTSMSPASMRGSSVSRSQIVSSRRSSERV